jgi:hypothetical protein
MHTVTANGLLGAARHPLHRRPPTPSGSGARNFGTANVGNAADSADPDGDGWTNEQEFISRTDPNSASACSNRPMQASGNDMNLTFPSVLGGTYRVERSGTMLDSSWATVQETSRHRRPHQITDTGGSGHSASIRSSWR